MLADLLTLLQILYYLIVGIMMVYGINYLYLVYLSLRKKGSYPIPPQPENWPLVTVQLPIYNEMYVAERVVEAVAAFDYPRDRLEIQVLDDSTDETVDILRKTVARLQERGVRVLHIRRQNRAGFKAGALAEGTKQAHGEFVAIFDADFVPPSNFLKQTVPYLLAYPKLAFVQTRWEHLNDAYSMLTTVQSVAIDGHFSVEQIARSKGGFLFNFNGTGGLWRRIAIEEAGGWHSDTLTEDLDLSYRAFLKGWEAIYLADIKIPGELPVSYNGFRRQQNRWARGSFECANKLLPKVWTSRKLSLARKIEATLHLTAYGIHILLFLLMLIYPLVLRMGWYQSGPLSYWGVGVILTLTGFAPAALLFAGQRIKGKSGWKEIPAIVFLTLLGSGLMLNTLRAFLQIFQNRKAVFERTPKFGISQGAKDWTKQQYQIKFDPLTYFEIAFALLNVFTIYIAVMVGNYWFGFYAAFFATGLFFSVLLSIVQSIMVYRSQNVAVASRS